MKKWKDKATKKKIWKSLYVLFFKWNQRGYYNWENVFYMILPRIVYNVIIKIIIRLIKKP